jgi:hypothetical protein
VEVYRILGDLGSLEDDKRVYSGSRASTLLSESVVLRSWRSAARKGIPGARAGVGFALEQH